MTSLSDLELVKVDAPIQPYGNWVLVRDWGGINDDTDTFLRLFSAPRPDQQKRARERRENFFSLISDPLTEIAPPYPPNTYIVDTLDEACAIFGEI